MADLESVQGNQNFPVPAVTDVSAYVGVSIWCDRFDIDFGMAELVAEWPVASSTAHQAGEHAP